MNRKKEQRKAFRSKALLIACLLLLLSAAAIAFELDWWTIDGASGTMAGGTYSLSGTIGQPEAGPPMSGGGYEVRGGFWFTPRQSQTDSKNWNLYQ